MKKAILSCFLAASSISLFAQDVPHDDYAQWPADKPETGTMEESQSRETKLLNKTRPQVIDMQDRMRTLFTNMMQNASEKIGWPMVEISEYTSDGDVYHWKYGKQVDPYPVPYPLCPPGAIRITFQFIVNNDSLQAWKTYETAYENQHLAAQQGDYSNIQSATQNPLYKQYQDSVNYYINLYTTYCNAHQNEGAALFTTDKHPKYYLQKQKIFTDKMVAMTDQTHAGSKIEPMEDEQKRQTIRFKNHTVVQVVFYVNSPLGNPFEKSAFSSTIKSAAAPYPVTGTRISRLYSTETINDFPWHYSLLMLLGNFLLNKKTQYGDYPAGFTLNGQNDLYTAKKIKCEKVQNIFVNIYGDKNNIEKMAKLIDVVKLNSTIVKQ